MPEGCRSQQGIGSHVQQSIPDEAVEVYERTFSVDIYKQKMLLKKDIKYKCLKLNLGVIMLNKVNFRNGDW